MHLPFYYFCVFFSPESIFNVNVIFFRFLKLSTLAGYSLNFIPVFSPKMYESKPFFLNELLCPVYRVGVLLPNDVTFSLFIVIRG